MQGCKGVGRNCAFFCVLSENTEMFLCVLSKNTKMFLLTSASKNHTKNTSGRKNDTTMITLKSWQLCQLFSVKRFVC